MNFFRRLLTLLDPDFEGEPSGTELEQVREALRGALARHNAAVAAAASQVDSIESTVAERKRLAAQSRAEAQALARQGQIEASRRATERAGVLRAEIDALRYEAREARLAYQVVIAARDEAIRDARLRIDAMRGGESDTAAASYLELGENIVVSHAEDSLASAGAIRDDLAEFVGDAELGRFAARGLDQIGGLHLKREGFLQRLGRKLNPGELTFLRYAGALEQVCLQVLGNLADASDALRLAEDIGADELKRRLEVLEAKQTDTLSSEVGRREWQALRDRLGLRDAQLERVEALLAENEQALTTVINASAAIADMRDLERQVDPSMQTVMEDLERLASRAKRFG